MSRRAPKRNPARLTPEHVTFEKFEELSLRDREGKQNPQYQRWSAMLTSTQTRRFNQLAREAPHLCYASGQIAPLELEDYERGRMPNETWEAYNDRTLGLVYRFPKEEGYLAFIRVVRHVTQRRADGTLHQVTVDPHDVTEVTRTTDGRTTVVATSRIATYLPCLDHRRMRERLAIDAKLKRIENPEADKPKPQPVRADVVSRPRPASPGLDLDGAITRLDSWADADDD